MACRCKRLALAQGRRAHGRCRGRRQQAARLVGAAVVVPCSVTHEVAHVPLCMRKEVALSWAGFVMVGPERPEETGNDATERVGYTHYGVSFRSDRNSYWTRGFHDLVVGAPKFEACVRSLQKVNELP